MVLLGTNNKHRFAGKLLKEFEIFLHIPTGVHEFIESKRHILKSKFQKTRIFWINMFEVPDLNNACTLVVNMRRLNCICCADNFLFLRLIFRSTHLSWLWKTFKILTYKITVDDIKTKAFPVPLIKVYLSYVSYHWEEEVAVCILQMTKPCAFLVSTT